MELIFNQGHDQLLWFPKSIYYSCKCINVTCDFNIALSNTQLQRRVASSLLILKILGLSSLLKSQC